MATVIYVGNYPFAFSDEDILDIFKDFEGLVLLRSLRMDRKCYSFILCQDQEQVMEVVLTCNGIGVGGRNLIVRASDDELQEIIDQYEGEEDDLNYESYATKNWDKGTPSAEYPQSSKTNYRQPRKPSRFASAKATTDSSNDIETRNSRKDCLTNKTSETDFVISPFEASCSETASFRSLSPSSVDASSHRKQCRGEKFSFVSIVNFPDGTTTEELQQMFSDYCPIKIIIQNQISCDDRPTEAVICFLKNKQATSAIMNLDNTLYHGRVVIVTEYDDISLVSDLMKVSCR